MQTQMGAESPNLYIANLPKEPPKLDLLQAQAPEEVIKSIIRPEIEEGQVLQKKKMWMEMEGK